MRCEATTKAGNQCRRDALDGSRFCSTHSGADAAVTEKNPASVAAHEWNERYREWKAGGRQGPKPARP